MSVWEWLSYASRSVTKTITLSKYVSHLSKFDMQLTIPELPNENKGPVEKVSSENDTGC